MYRLTHFFLSSKKLKLALILTVSFLIASCSYMKMDPPSDTDKAGVANPPIVNDNSCWMATAANMLAGAGYGNGASLQARAVDIYNDLVAWQTIPTNPTGIANGGWTDTAINWWIGSANNIWLTNTYTDVTVHGNKSPKIPWADANGAQFIGNELRSCQFLGLSISWPTFGASIGSGGHAITGWGDHNGSGTLSVNPNRVRVSDSDTDAGGDVQSYSYDTYTNPNPSGPNEGNGWYFDYDANHPYIKHIITLCPTQTAAGQMTTQKVVGSYRIHQSNEIKAIDLHYDVSTDVNILSYKTDIDWTSDAQPSITESSPTRNKLTVNWEFKEKPIPYCTWVTITTEFILPAWNAIKYNNVHFTYPDQSIIEKFPDLYWELQTPKIKNAAEIQDVTGGYVIGAFDVVDPKLSSSNSIVAEYRFIHEYSYNQSPEEHTLYLSGAEDYVVTNLRLGHSYGYPSTKDIWQFEKWMTNETGKYPLGKEKVVIEIDWKGRLPYPKGEDIQGRIREIKSDSINK